jgi:hypothetical protein
VIVETKSTWHHFQVRFSEWYSGFVLFAWGIYVTMHPGMFTDPKAGQMFQGMVGIASQVTWGMVGTLVGFARLAALYVNGNHRRTPSVRLMASFFSLFVWTQVVLGMWAAGIAQTGVIVYTGLVCADIYSAFRASGDVTLITRRHAKKAEESRGAVSSKPHP